MQISNFSGNLLQIESYVMGEGGDKIILLFQVVESI